MGWVLDDLGSRVGFGVRLEQLEVAACRQRGFPLGCTNEASTFPLLFFLGGLGGWGLGMHWVYGLDFNTSGSEASH